MASDKVDILNRRTVYDGYFQVHEYRFTHVKFDGSRSEVLTREVLDRGHVCAVLPVDVQRDLVVLIEQFRPGAYAAGEEPWLVECVAGVIETGETGEEVAIRESLEEANCQIKALHPVTQYLSSPGSSSETVQLFCGLTDASGLGGIHGLASEGEDIRVETVPVATAIEWLDAGRIRNAKTIIVLQWLARHYDRLKAKWS